MGTGRTDEFRRHAAWIKTCKSPCLNMCEPPDHLRPIRGFPGDTSSGFRDTFPGSEAAPHWLRAHGPQWATVQHQGRPRTAHRSVTREALFGTARG